MRGRNPQVVGQGSLQEYLGSRDPTPDLSWWLADDRFYVEN